MAEEQARIEIVDEDLLIIEKEKDSGLAYRERRHPDWNDNYTLYRDEVTTNRLTQRQTINIPLMKYGINTILKDIDELPGLYFANLDNDEQKEVFYNEHWKETARVNKIIIQDIIDKKQAMLFGRTFKKLNVIDGKIAFEVVDPQDMLVHRYVDPANLDSAECLIQTKIYRTLRSITENDDYDQEARDQLELYFTQESTDVEQENTMARAQEKSERLEDLGVTDAENPIVGETYVELNEVYRFEQEDVEEEDGEKESTNLIHLTIVAVTEGGMYKLLKEPLYEIIGPTIDDYWFSHYPYSSWTPDPERTDFWSDGIADIIRNANKVLNAWISQLVENRTLRNFGMTFYDSSNPQFIPQTFIPMSWGFYPVPGDPNKVMRSVDIPDLSESLDEIQFLINISEKATGATSANAGDVEQRQVTLGEVELALGEAQKRTKSMETYYTEAWKDFGEKYVKMVEATKDILEPITISKRGRQGKKMYTKEISPKDWDTRNGYAVEVKILEDKQAEDIESIQKLLIVRADMPNNAPLREIYTKKMLEFAGLSVEEIQQVEEYERRGPQVQEQPLLDQPADGEQPELVQVPNIAPGV